MGAVYLAERADQQFQKRVAIKVLKREADSPDSLLRFKAERQMLAALDHPSIVRLLDAGVTSNGIPCVIMDYVDGVTIDRYCAEKKPSIAERLRLFAAICGAVHYAHQRLVVHCDIKPANILVAPDGTPKLLDFGIAKLLSSSSETPATGSGPLTLDHASPEQLLGRPITTSTDIYALGLALYEMLVGSGPYSATSDIEMVYKITRTDPVPPSIVTGNAALRGDLDAIVLKAMAKDPAARYASVAEIADDVQRHLAMQPISLLSGSPRYRISKFVLRNRFAVTAAGMGLILLVVMTTVTVWEGFVARQQRTLAERRFNDVRQLVNTLLFDFYDAASKIPGATPLQEHMVERSVGYLDSLAKEAANNVPLAVDVVDAYVKFGDIQGNPYQPNLGQTDAAVVSYQKALDVAGKLLQHNPDNKELLRVSARAHQEMADVLTMQGKGKEGIAQVREAEAIFEKLVKEDPNNAQAYMDLASCLEGMGDQLGHPGLVSMGNETGALESYKKSLENNRNVLRLDPNHQRAKRGAAIVYMKMADLESHRGNSAAALKMYREALASTSGFAPDFNSRRLTAMLERKLGTELDATDPEAEQHLLKSLSEFESNSAADPMNARAKLDLADIWDSLADYYDARQNYIKALESLRKTAEIVGALGRSDPSNTRYPMQLSAVFLRVGGVMVKSGQVDEATRQTRRGLEIIRKLAEESGAPAGELRRAALAFLYCTPEPLREPRRAVSYAKRAVELTNSAEAPYLDLLSEAQIAAGMKAEALDTVRKALALNPSESLKKGLEAKLATLTATR